MHETAQAADRRWRIKRTDHVSLAMARRIRAVWAEAAAQEARLLQAPMPPLCVLPGPASKAIVIGALDNDELLGALVLEPTDEPGQLGISTLVVLPALQRRGIGRALVTEALLCADAAAGTVVTVVTALANAPALALYFGCGFVEHRRGMMAGAAGSDGLLIVQLRRPAPARH
jgi:ribosomal protein S18 acetylase RimI-like enzyme